MEKKILNNKWFKTLETLNQVAYTYNSLLFPLAETKFILIEYMECKGYILLNVSNLGCTYLFKKEVDK